MIGALDLMPSEIQIVSRFYTSKIQWKDLEAVDLQQSVLGNHGKTIRKDEQDEQDEEIDAKFARTELLSNATLIGGRPCEAANGLPRECRFVLLPLLQKRARPTIHEGQI